MVEIAEKRQLDKKVKIARLAVYFLGIIPIFWYFWCFIALIIGLLFFLFSKDPAWKRNGIVLAFYVGIINVAVFFDDSLPPLNLVAYVTFPFFFIYAIILLVPDKIPKLKAIRLRILDWYEKNVTNLSGNSKKLLKITAVLIPTVLWSSVNLDLGVMFDNETKSLWIHAPSTVEIGDEFEITVEAWDSFERLSAIYNGEVEFSLISYNKSDYTVLNDVEASLPKKYTFTEQMIGSDAAEQIQDGKDNGRHVFEMKINTPGIHYILVEDSTTENIYYSNPIIVDNFEGTSRYIFWGDIHTHSGLSDGSGTPEECFSYARDVACLDFFALTDHAEIMMWTPPYFDWVESVCNDYYDKGEFVTFQGVEWTNTRTGHYTCIFSGDQLLKDPMLSYVILPTTDGLWNALDEFTEETGDRALALPHHTTKKTYIQDWTYINPDYVKIAEVTSTHGECLFEPRHELNYRGCTGEPPEYTYGSSVMDAYIMGYRLTAYAASDQHDGHPGHSLSHTRAYIGHQRPYSTWLTRNDKPYPGGLTAVFAEKLTRDAVFKGLENQRIFANSEHGRPILIFKMNGTSVGDGSTLEVASKDSHREINIFLAQDGNPAASKNHAASVNADWEPEWDAEIEIIKNGELWESVKIEDPIVNLTLIDDEEISGTSFEEYCIERDGKYYINDYSDNPIEPEDLNTKGFDFYLVRVVNEKGRTSYAGPIWVEY